MYRKFTNLVPRLVGELYVQFAESGENVQTIEASLTEPNYGG